MQRNLRDFKTFNDPQLLRMLSEVERFIEEIKNPKSAPRWITLAGTSGTGKTFLADIICRVAMSLPHLSSHRILKNGVHWHHWPELSRRLLNDREYWRIDDLIAAHFIYIDEIGTSHFSTDALVQVCLGRTKKWSVLTCNKKLDWISEQMDARIASRMVRDGSVIVEVDTIDFSLR